MLYLCSDVPAFLSIIPLPPNVLLSMEPYPSKFTLSCSVAEKQPWALCSGYQLGLQNVSSYVLVWFCFKIKKSLSFLKLHVSCHSVYGWSCYLTDETDTKVSQSRVVEELLEVAEGTGQTSRNLPSGAVGLTSFHVADRLTPSHNRGLLVFQWLLCILWDAPFCDLCWYPSISSSNSQQHPVFCSSLCWNPGTSSTSAMAHSGFWEICWKALIWVFYQLVWGQNSEHTSLLETEQNHDVMRRTKLVRNLK